MTVRRRLTKSFGAYSSSAAMWICDNPYINRVLREGCGTFIYLTFGQPHFRKRYLNREDATLEIKQIGDAFHYYFYILRT